MRTCKGDEDGLKCKTCGCDRNHCLDMFEICFVGAETKKKASLILCDDCVDALFYKTLKATCYVNNRLKNQRDLTISNNRKSKAFTEQYGEQEHRSINPIKEQKDEWDEVIEEYGE